MRAVEKVSYKPIDESAPAVLRELVEKLLIFEPEERLDTYQCAQLLHNQFM